MVSGRKDDGDMETVIFFVDGEKNRGLFRGDLGLRRAVSGISGLACLLWALACFCVALYIINKV